MADTTIHRLVGIDFGTSTSLILVKRYQGDQVRTIISYPAKWKKETIAFMEEVAADASFPNISSMDEPSAALYAVLCRKMDDIAKQGLLSDGQSGYVLLIDMGAGTTDLALCAYSISDYDGDLIAADRIKTNIVSTYPTDSSSLTFGGREVDRILEDYLIQDAKLIHYCTILELRVNQACG